LPAFRRIWRVRTTLSATSETDLETVIASTTVVGGVLALDTEKGAGKVKLTLPLASLRTGIEQRDEHLRGPDWLDAAKFPDIDFESTRLARKDAKTWLVEANFTMHGQTRAVSLEVTVREITVEMAQKARWGDKPGYGVSGRFPVRLSDFGVAIPQVAAAKVRDEWTVALDLVALAA
jgi:polyisoprenoid-binding protein YceI